MLFKVRWVREAYTKQQGKLNDIGLDRLKGLISGYQKELMVGNYFIDNRCEKIMSDKFGDNIVNYKPSVSHKKIENCAG